MIETLAHRAGLYKLLSVGFLFPDAEVARFFSAGQASGLPGNCALSRFLAYLWARRPTADTLVSEFNHLFLAKQAVPPYESEFCCRNEFEKARNLADIAGFYSAFAVAPCHERPDHISSELEFLHLLLAKEIQARRENNAEHLEVTLDAERHFFREHLSGWAPSFVQAVRRNAPPESFYFNLCGLLEAFLKKEAERIGETK